MLFMGEKHPEQGIGESKVDRLLTANPGLRRLDPADELETPEDVGAYREAAAEGCDRRGCGAVGDDVCALPTPAGKAAMRSSTRSACGCSG
jgi:hypothetical protein